MIVLTGEGEYAFCAGGDQKFVVTTAVIKMIVVYIT
ncbi:naphthoate synthase [Actinobacillus equuli]|nr:naphthoate synthase [Actinobacillus equuli]